MSPSPPFPSPLLPPHSHSPSAGRPGIIGEHRPSQTIPQHQGGIGTGTGLGSETGTGTGTEPSDGDYLLYLLQAGKQHRVPQQQQHGRNEGGRYDQQQQQRPQLLSQPNLGMPVPGIAPGGGENLMAAWDPAVAALGPSHSFNHRGMVGRLPPDDRDFQYPSPPFHGGHMGSGWGPHHQTLLHPFAASPPLPLPGASLPLSPSTDFGGQFLGQSSISNRNGLPESITGGGGGHMDFVQRRFMDGNSFEYHESQLRRMHSGIQPSSNLPLEPRFRGVGGNPERGNHQQHQQFFGDGAELMKLLQISGAKNSGEGASELKPVDSAAGAGGVCGSPAAGPKMNPAIAHGPIGPPKRSDGMAGPNLADDLLGRFWPAPAASGGNEPAPNLVQKAPPFGVVENSAGFSSKGPSRWGEKPCPAPELFDRSVRGSESFLAPTLVSRDGGGGPRFVRQNVWFSGSKLVEGGATGLPDNLELYNGRGLLGNWVGNPEGIGGSAAAAAGGGEQFGIGGFDARNREGQGNFVKVSEHQSGPSLTPFAHEQLQQSQQQHHRADGLPTKEVERDHHLRDAIGRLEPGRVAAGGVRRGAGFRGEPGGRRGGRSLIGQWVAVNDKQKDREGSETGFPSDAGTESSSSEKGCSSATNSIKDEAISVTRDACGPQKGGGRDESKRRKGQQEWRMKSPSGNVQVQNQAQASPVLKSSDFGMDSDSSDAGNGNHPVSILFKMRPLASQVDHPGLPSNVLQDAAATPGSAIEESKTIYHGRGDNQANGGIDSSARTLEKEDDDDMPESYDERGIRQVHTPAQEEFEPGVRQDYTREFRKFSHRTPVPYKLDMRPDLEKFTSQLLEIYVSLIPTEEEIRTRRQFLSHLDHLVSREWPGAMLFLFGSCANAFGVCNSDIDICLSISDDQPSKADSVLKMAAILRSDDMQNVVALTHARVPIVKFTDPTTGISCDICVNNKLAVVNSKLLHDYSLIDVRLRQLAFLVKHWAKRRQVNETYRGTLSSYAYVLMCIHFLQQRKPPILPCLQEMPPTYSVTVCDIDSSYYDRVETLQNFGSPNKESLGELLTSFFEYWAFRHDYNKSVISVRTGGYLSKDEKEWTRRIGNERHLICIEDPLEVTHDLGRVVDRHSIRVLRDEFHRAAKILRYDVNPCFALFERYVRDKP